MSVYLSMGLVSIIFAILSRNFKKAYGKVSTLTNENVNTHQIHGYLLSKLFALYSFIPLFAISALRWNVGTDFSNYLKGYEIITSGKDTRFEFGFDFLQRSLAYIGASPIWLFVITSLLFCTLIFLGIYKYSLRPEISILVLLGSQFYFFSMNGIRQGIAVAICFFCIKYLYEKKYITFILLILLASSFHVSALISLPLYVFFSKMYNIKQYIVITVIFLLFIMNLEKITDILLYYFAPNYLSPYNKATMYVDMTKSNYIRFALMLITLYYAKPLLKLNRVNLMFIHFQPIIFFTYFLVPFKIMYRLVMYIEIFNIILIPSIIMAEKNKKVRLVLILCVCSYYIYMFISSILNGSHDVIPYKSIFSSI